LFVQKCEINDPSWSAMSATRLAYSNMPKSWGRALAPKTVMCQYEGCGKTFCHSCHLYRHQRQKHGQQYKYNRASWQDPFVAHCCNIHVTGAHNFLQSE